MTRKRPNIIVFLTDDQGYGDLGIYRNPDLDTPHIDRIGQEGLCLNQHYTASPICAPARAALLTGRYNHRVGALSVESNRGLDRIALGESTIADVFKANGYATGMVGKWHNGLHDMRYHPNNRGFDEFAGFLKRSDELLETGSSNTTDSRNGPGRDGNLTDVFYAGDAIEFIERHKNRAVLFSTSAYNAPTRVPLEAPEEDVPTL